MRKPFNGNFPITQTFGVNPETYKQFLVKQPDGTTGPLQGHNGIDYGMPDGTEIVAPHPGKVTEVGFDASGYGNYVKLESEAEGSVVAHLQKVDVSLGFVLNEGDHIGFSDNTGFSTGPHLHWGYFRQPRDRANGFGGFIDQQPLLDAIGKQNPVETKLYTKEEYDAAMNDRERFWKERDEVTAQLKEMTEKYNDVNGKYTAFLALGYQKVEDFTKALADKDAQIEKLQIETLQVKQRNIDLLGQLQKQEQEDCTAIDMGIKAARELTEARDNLIAISKAAGVDKKTNILSLIVHIEETVRLASKALKQGAKEAEAAGVKDAEEKVAELEAKVEKKTRDLQESGFKWLLKFLRLA